MYCRRVVLPGLILLMAAASSGTAYTASDSAAEWRNYVAEYEAYMVEYQEWVEEMFRSYEAEIDLLLALLEESRRNSVEIDSVANPVIAGLIRGSINYYIAPLPEYSTYDVSLFDDYLNGLYAEGVSINRVDDIYDADFSIDWVKDSGPHGPLGVAYGNAVTVGLGSSACGDWQHFDNFTITQIAWHEIGHVLGYGHSTDPNNIMYKEGDVRFVYDMEIDEVIPDGWYYTFPFCTGGLQYFEVSTEREGEGVEVFVITPETDPIAFLDGGEGRYYPECGEPKATWHVYSETCTVEPGASLVVYNSGEPEAVRVQGYIQDRNPYPKVDMRWDEDAYLHNSEYLDYVRLLYDVPS